MAEQTISAPIMRRRPDSRSSSRRVGNPILEHPWWATAVMVLVVAVAFVLLTGMRPAYDAYGWLVWGRQAAHFDLDTNAAPSWKPLTFLFTFPYAVLVGRGALWLWMVTAVAGAFAGSVFAARIAYRLTGPTPQRRYAPIAAALFAGAGILGLQDYWHLVLIATSDAMIVTLCLAAIDRHLSGAPRQAWVLLVLASLGRPEAWPVTFLYGLWAWRAIPPMRRQVAVGLAVIPLLWFGMAGLTSHSWTIAGDVALGTAAAAKGHAVSRVVDQFLSLYELPMKLAALLALAYAVVRRERTWLVLAAAALLWVLVEVAFGFHGWSGNRRYMFSAGAVMVVLAGAGVGRVLAIEPRRWPMLRWVALAAVLALVVSLLPHARNRARLAHNGIVAGHTWTRQLNRLHQLVIRLGGRKQILACGQAVTFVGFQSILAWEIGENVVDVGWDPPTWIKHGKPIVLFWPRGAGFEVQPMNYPASSRAKCERLRTHTQFSQTKTHRTASA